jgi:hypothetical protein
MRQLSAYEGLILDRARKGIYNNFIVAAEYLIPLSKEILINAVTSLCQKYPHFSLRVEEYKSVFAQPYTIDDSFIEILSTGTVSDICEKFTLYQFKYHNIHEPLFKVIYADHLNAVFFVTDHVYFDGTAAKNFHYHLANSLGVNTVDKFINTTKFNFYPDPTKILNFQEKHSQKTIVKESLKPDLDQNLLNMPMSKHNSTFIYLPAEDTKKLINSARENNTKITSLFQAIGAKIIANLINSENIFKSTVAINTRFKIELTPDYINLTQFGIFYGKYFNETNSNDIRKLDIITLSQIFQGKLSENMENAMQNAEISEAIASKDYNFVDQTMQNLFNRNDKPEVTFAISNLGVLSSSIIGKTYFDQPMVDSSFALYIISSDSGLTLNIASHRAIPAELYKQFVEEFCNTLYKFI